jgi:hypothetical protein
MPIQLLTDGFPVSNMSVVRISPQMRPFHQPSDVNLTRSIPTVEWYQGLPDHGNTAERKWGE